MLNDKTYPVSETSKWRHITVPYCQGVGLDVGASGDPVVPTAICCDLPQPYCPAMGPVPIHIPVDARHVHKYFRLLSLDYVYSSHLLEDFENWASLVQNWMDLIKPGGFLVIVVPERDLWKRALDRGQPPNLAHRHEFKIGELSGMIRGEPAIAEDWDFVVEGIPDEKDYTLIFIARRRNKTGVL